MNEEAARQVQGADQREHRQHASRQVNARVAERARRDRRGIRGGVPASFTTGCAWPLSGFVEISGRKIRIDRLYLAEHNQYQDY
jgi:hypothetical protein